MFNRDRTNKTQQRYTTTSASNARRRSTKLLNACSCGKFLYNLCEYKLLFIYFKHRIICMNLFKCLHLSVIFSESKRSQRRSKFNFSFLLSFSIIFFLCTSTIHIFILYKNVITHKHLKCEYHWAKCL